MLEKRNRIGKITASFMTLVAGGIDGLQVLLTFLAFAGVILNSFISIVAWLLFFLWFKFSDVSFWDGGARRIIIWGGGLFVEMLPLFNNFPVWTFMVVSMIVLVRAEDALHNKKVEREIIRMNKELQAAA